MPGRKRIISMIFLVASLPVKAQNIHLPTIAAIESNNRNIAGDNGKSLGVYQIGWGVVEDFNKRYCAGAQVKYSHRDMFYKPYADMVADITFNKIIPAKLKHWGFKDTVKNRIIVWNAKYAYQILKGKRKLPKVTAKYIRDYKRLTKHIFMRGS